MYSHRSRLEGGFKKKSDCIAKPKTLIRCAVVLYNHDHFPIRVIEEIGSENAF